MTVSYCRDERQVRQAGRSHLRLFCRLHVSVLIVRHVISKDGERDVHLGRGAISLVNLIECLTALVDDIRRDSQVVFPATHDL